MNRASGGFESLLDRLGEDELAALSHLIACPWCSGDFLVDLAVLKGPELLLRREMPPPTDAGLQALGEFESRGAQARYRRAKGLMYWQQGELELAEQHLVQAVTDFSRVDENGEEGATLTLLGLLLQEEGKPLPFVW